MNTPIATFHGYRINGVAHVDVICMGLEIPLDCFFPIDFSIEWEDDDLSKPRRIDWGNKSMDSAYLAAELLFLTVGHESSFLQAAFEFTNQVVSRLDKQSWSMDETDVIAWCKSFYSTHREP